MVNKQKYVFSGVMLVLIAVWSSEAQDLKTPWLVYTNSYSINGLEMDTWINDIVISRLHNSPVSVDYHFTQGYLYWTSRYQDEVTRANLSNTADREDLVPNSRSKPGDMAVDWIYNHIYWIDTTHKHIKMANLDGSLGKTLIDRDLVLPRAIVVDPNAGWLFFTDVSNPRIIRCGLDGSDIQTIVSNITTNIREPNGLSIDFSSKRLYWIDSVYKQIQSSKLNGKDIIKLLTSPEYMALARGLIVFRDWIYWISSHKIYRVYKENGSNVEVIKSNLNNARGIKIYSPENQPTGDNVCGQHNGGCEQLCLQSPQSTIKCACADGFKLKNDSNSCLNIGSGNWLTFSNYRKIERVDVETRVIENIATGNVYANGLDIHYSKGLVYWTGYNKIMRSSVTKDSVSRVVEDVVTEDNIRPYGIAVDWIYHLLYWTDSSNRIQVSQLDGRSRRTIVKNDSYGRLRAIVVDPIRGWLFFSVTNANGRIERCRMDGTDRIIIVDEDIKQPNGMSIDNIGERLYWVDSQLNQINSTKFDGSDPKTILKNKTIMPYPYDLVVFDSYVYWTNLRYRPNIYRINQYTGHNLTLVVSNVDYSKGIQMFGAGAQVNGSNLCGDNNGMCSHICFPLPAYNMSKSTKTGCMCPDFFILEADNNTCTEIESPSNIVINVTSSHRIAITWTLPVTSSDVIQQTNVILYDGNNYMQSEVVYDLDTSLIITRRKLMTPCGLYAVKLRCKYSKVGWSQYHEEKFWATDNIIDVEKGKHAVISWITKVHRLKYNVAFNQLSSQTDDLIYAEGKLQKNSTRYKYLTQIKHHIQFTLTQVNRSDVGLYKSMSTSKRPSIDGCALLVMKDKPQKPNITFNKYPFVNGQTIFVCISRVQRWPTFVPYSLQYSWSVSGGVRNILTIYPISRLDKGKNISCRATDDHGLISDSSEVITLDPYYGPDNVVLSISGDHVNVTQGRQLGPITCSAVCYPECDYTWKRFKNGVYSTVIMGQSFTVPSASMNDSGSYICYVAHKNDSSRIDTIIMTIYVNDKPTASTVASTIATNFTAIMSNPSNKNVDKGDDTKDAILYSVVGSVIVIGIVAGLIIFYYRRRRHQHISERESSDDLNLASQMEIKYPDECDL